MLRRILTALMFVLAAEASGVAGPLASTDPADQPADAMASRPFPLVDEKGDGDAENRLAIDYFSGQGMPQDYGQAAKWFRLAAQHGNASAQFSLGSLYLNGQGVPQDYGEAAKW